MSHKLGVVIPDAIPEVRRIKPKPRGRPPAPSHAPPHMKKRPGPGGMGPPPGFRPRPGGLVPGLGGEGKEEGGGEESVGAPDPIAVGRRGTGAIAPVGDVSDNHAGTAPKMKPRIGADKRQSRGEGEALTTDAALQFMTEERREFDREVISHL